MDRSLAFSVKMVYNAHYQAFSIPLTDGVLSAVQWQLFGRVFAFSFAHFQFELNVFQLQWVVIMK